jgi:hypothetical protein
MMSLRQRWISRDAVMSPFLLVLFLFNRQGRRGDKKSNTIS